MTSVNALKGATFISTTPLMVCMAWLDGVSMP